MIVSHRYRFIFLHSYKTGGSSISVSLGRYLDFDDLLGGPIPDFVVHGVNPRPFRKAACQSFLHSFFYCATLTSPALARISPVMAGKIGRKWRSLYGQSMRRGLSTHTKAYKAREILGDEVWSTYYKFAFERNPWDRMVSLYNWRYRLYPERPLFSDYLKAVAEGGSYAKKMRADRSSNWPIYTIGGKIAVDFIGRFECLADDLNATLSKIGVPFDGWLPQAKRMKSGQAYQSFYDGKTRDLVGKLFQKEIELMGYRF